MKVFGNIKGLKKAIKEKYSSKIDDIKRERNKEIEKINNELKERVKLKKSNMKVILESERKKAFSMVMSSTELKSKSEFEEKRESLIMSVVKEAYEKAKKIVHTKQYLDFVKKNMPKDKSLSIIGDSDFYKKDFSKIKIDKSIVGIKFIGEYITYDFTLDNLISSKKEILRHEINKILFG